MATATGERQLDGDKAQRIVDAMRACVGRYGAHGATFAHVAAEAGVSRGLLHYYFGTKERLLVETVRRDCEVQLAQLDAAIAAAEGTPAILELLARWATEGVDTPDPYVLILELRALAIHNEVIRAAVAQLSAELCAKIAGLLADAQAQGLVKLAGEPEEIAEMLYVLGDGLKTQMLIDPERDYGPTIAASLRAAGVLVSQTPV